jgi:hypothetical protein
LACFTTPSSAKYGPGAVRAVTEVSTRKATGSQWMPGNQIRSRRRSFPHAQVAKSGRNARSIRCTYGEIGPPGAPRVSTREMARSGSMKTLVTSKGSVARNRISQ